MNKEGEGIAISGIARANRLSVPGMIVLALLLACDGEGRRGDFSEIGVDILPLTCCSLSCGDYDNDGDLDLVVAGKHWETQTPMTTVYRNDGGVFTDTASGLEGVPWGSVVWGDYDSDGDLDLALAGWQYAKVYRNDAGSFTDVGAALTPVSFSALAWGDCDNDGDLDLALAGYTSWDGGIDVSKVYRNDGGILTDVNAPLTGVLKGSLAWGDYDNDGDLDLALTGTNGGSKVYRNDGGAFTDAGAGLQGMGYSSLAWGDYDNDGDLDLALSGYFGGLDGQEETKIYRNDGAGDLVDIGAGIEGTYLGSVAWGDYDNDGDSDLALVGSGHSKVYRNDGGGSFTDIGAGLTDVINGSLAWFDYDNDNDLDLLIAGLGRDDYATIKLYRNNCRVPNTPPAAPCALGSTVLGSNVILSWNAATDAETPVPGLSYNLNVWPESGTEDVMPGMGDPVTGYRRVPALGNAQKRCFWIVKGLASGTYYWTVQAIDTAFEGSPWAPEETFIVP